MQTFFVANHSLTQIDMRRSNPRPRQIPQDRQAMVGIRQM
jgi:hypothetical protein